MSTVESDVPGDEESSQTKVERPLLDNEGVTTDKNGDSVLVHPIPQSSDGETGIDD